MSEQLVLPEPDDSVSRGRYERERTARLEAERLLEQKSRELYEANQRLERALQKSQEIADLRANFITSLSHEFRTPLTVIKGSADRLVKSGCAECPTLKARCDTIQDSVARLIALIEICSKATTL